MTERVFPARPFEIGGGRIVPSPNQFYLTGEDNLRVVSANAVAGVRITIACRTANPQGDTVAQSLPHVPNSDRTKATQDYNIGSGSLLNVTAFVSAGAPLIGQTYVLIQVVRGLGASAVVLGTILAGYVTTTQPLGFPGSPIQSSIEGPGAIRTIAGTVPGLGLEVSEVVPTGARWELQSFNVAIVPGAIFAKRVPILVITTPALLQFEIAATDGVDAPNSLRVSWMTGVGTSGLIVNSRLHQSLPVSFPLVAGTLLSTLTGALVGSDQYTFVHYTVREWLEVP